MVESTTKQWSISVCKHRHKIINYHLLKNSSDFDLQVINAINAGVSLVTENIVYLVRFKRQCHQSSRHVRSAGSNSENGLGRMMTQRIYARFLNYLNYTLPSYLAFCTLKLSESSVGWGKRGIDEGMFLLLTCRQLLKIGALLNVHRNFVVDFYVHTRIVVDHLWFFWYFLATGKQ
jgi:hypothetical protein